MYVKKLDCIDVSDDLRFTLSGNECEYRFHVDQPTGELVHDYFGDVTGAPDSQSTVEDDPIDLNRVGRELPDIGRGDYRSPAVHIRHDGRGGHTVNRFQYSSYRLVEGKESLQGLPVTFGGVQDVQSLLVTLKDEVAKLNLELHYSIFPHLNVITRSWKLGNQSDAKVTIERAASINLDMGTTNETWDMTYLRGDAGLETQRTRRSIEYGTQGFGSTIGYSSHYHNPFVALSPRSTTDTSGQVLGLSLIYSGSFAANVEKSSPGITRVQLGLNPLHLSYPVAPGETFTSPECVLVYEGKEGLGGMTRSFHRLYRHHLMRSKFALTTRPVLINHWEATAFDYDENVLYSIAKAGAEIGAKLFVMDDGWFGTKYPRTSDTSGLGDWEPNPDRFKDGLDSFISRIKTIKPKGSSDNMKFGLWVEPEMVNPKSELYDNHPDWALHVEGYPRTTGRNQLILNLALKEVQDHLIAVFTKLISTNKIDYVKWDKNRVMHEITSPDTAHRYVLGLYRVMETLTTRFPDILFEGCASGGGRFDPGMLHYFPQNWTSDMTDPLERVYIQFGTTLVYPASTMGCHVSVSPSQVIGRATPIRFRAHVAMMGGSYGYELDPSKLANEETKTVTHLSAVSERVNKYVVEGDMYRLAVPEESNWPAMQYKIPSSGSCVLIALQLFKRSNVAPPPLLLQGLEPEATYQIKMDDDADYITRSGAHLMNEGMVISWQGDFDSKLVWVDKTS